MIAPYLAKHQEEKKTQKNTKEIHKKNVQKLRDKRYEKHKFRNVNHSDNISSAKSVYEFRGNSRQNTNRWFNDGLRLYTV